jgi:hypothetical protein
MGTFTLGRNIGLFGADAILNDMTLPGVGAPGTAASAAPSNTTLGGIGFGYIYTDWLAQIDYTTPDISGFSFTVGIFDPLNSLSEAPVGACPAAVPDCNFVEPKKAPGFHGKLSFTLPLSDTSKIYASVAGLTQKQNYNDTSIGGLGAYDYTGNAIDVFVRADISDLEVFGYYYHGTGVGTTALFLLGAYQGQTRKSDGFLVQGTYKFGALKVGLQYGESKLDYANGTDQADNPFLVSKNKKGTLGLYYSLTENLTLLAEGSEVKSDSHAGGDNKATTINAGAFFKF